MTSDGGQRADEPRGENPIDRLPALVGLRQLFDHTENTVAFSRAFTSECYFADKLHNVER